MIPRARVKTQHIWISLSGNDSASIKAASREELEKVDNFVFLGSRTMEIERGFEVEKGRHKELVTNSRTSGSGSQGCEER
jgi:hypothetical protein